MKEKWNKIKKPLCAIIMEICLFLLLGCTGTAENGGDLGVYIIHGTVLLLITLIAGTVGGIIG